MHTAHATETLPKDSSDAKIEFIWMELTNRCNLNCAHCYSESSPYSGDADVLTESQHLRLIEEARALGCKQIQFIGGEPILNKSLPRLIEQASACEYELIEVFTNLIKLDPSLLEIFKENSVKVATSFYSKDQATHDAITRVDGSFEKTVKNIKRVLDAGLDLRVGVIEMEQNAGEFEATSDYLQSLGVQSIGLDHVRGFGRAQEKSSCSMDELCGQCSTNILAIGPDGVVAPCIMSRHWSVGSTLENSLSEIVASDLLSRTRQEIAVATATKSANCYPQCGPNNNRCTPECAPSASCSPCSPNGSYKCQPNGWCSPAR